MNAVMDSTRIKSSTEEDSENYTASLGALEKKVLAMLGSGVSATIVASAVGVGDSYISQLVSVPQFAYEVAKLRMQNTQQYIDTDSKYDSIESKLLKKLEDCLPLMMRPLEILRAIQVINGAKRKTGLGSDTGNNTVAVQQVVQLTLPNVIVQKFTTNINNQVVTAGAQNLVTANSIQLQQMAQKTIDTEVKEERTVIQERVKVLLDTKTRERESKEVKEIDILDI